MLLFISRNVLIQQVIRNAGHRVLYRAPYYAVDGPIEYIFNTIQQALTLALYRITDENGLCQEIYAIVAGIMSFASYFEHCGYRIN
jgi:hypothetical protein